MHEPTDPPPHDQPFVARVRLVVVASALAAWAVATLALNAPGGGALAQPGPLSAAHAPLEERCDTCHSAGPDAVQGPLAGWLASDLALDQSAHCLACHDLGDDPLGPHGWSFAAAEERRHAAGGSAELVPLERAASAPFSAAGELACATCHREHQGRAHELTALADRSCQACHLERYDHFAVDHPDFSDYPAARRTGLVFDHESHVTRHFRGELAELAPERCTDCHVPDAAGGAMELAGYATSCAACHDDDVAGRGQLDGAGHAFLGFPALDLLTLEERDVPIGVWPADALEVETPLPPFAAFLLAGDAAAARDLATLDAIDPLDLLDADDDALDAAARLAWRTKRLFGALATDGHTALWEALERRLGRPLGPDERNALTGALPAELWRAALDAWAHDLDGELATLAGGDAPPTTLAPPGGRIEDDPARERWVSGGGWYLRHTDFTVRYRPQGHADPFLRTWLDLAAEHDDSLFEHLARPDAPGACTKCHAVEDSGSGPRVRWHANRPGDRLTPFRHRPHLVGGGANACSTCHELGPHSEAYERSFEDRDPTTFTSSFEPLERASCATCHAEGAAPSSCTDCHGYHAHTPRAASESTPLTELFPGRSPGQ